MNHIIIRSKRYRIRGFVLLLVIGLLAACGQAAPDGSGAAAGTAPTAAQAALTPILAASELVIGSNRLPLGVVRNRGQGLPFGLYVAYPSFDKAGTWGIEAQISVDGSAPQSSRFRIDVLAAPKTPAVGSQATPSKNPTIKVDCAARTLPPKLVVQ